MPAKILSGKEFADAINLETKAEIERFAEAHGRRPGLSVVRVGEDPASEVYVSKKVKTARELGIVSHHHHLPESTSGEDLLRIVADLNANEEVDGILVQLPLPKAIDERKILESISAFKDVDGFHPVNAGNLWLGHESLVPCTPAGVIEILKRSGIATSGKRAVVVGRSNIVGKPMAALLLKEHATVTIAHSRTPNLDTVTRQADILIAAVGRPAFLTAEYIKEGAVVIDVGINRYENGSNLNEIFPDDEIEKRTKAITERGFTLIGDVNPRDAMERASHFTPVPGGVGLLTVAMLMRNTATAAKLRASAYEI
jgi:methylenetetrahydrofolate dehydrogenase (NADP+) / methenyltetrahydrofolate cyclohydrolase